MEFINNTLIELNKPITWSRILFYGFRTLCIMILLSGLGSLLISFRALSDLPFFSTLGALAIQATFACAIVVSAIVGWSRSSIFDTLQASDPYPFIRLYSYGIKIAGECYASFIAIGSIGGTIGIWLMGKDGHWLLNSLNPFLVDGSDSGNAFFSGLSVSLMGIPLALAALFFAYMLAELSVPLADIAINTRKLGNTGSPKDKDSGLSAVN